MCTELYQYCAHNISQVHAIQSHRPVNRHLLDEDIHSGQQQLMVLPECTQHMNHGVLQHALHLQWQANVHNLTSQANRHQLWHWKKLQPTEIFVRV